MTSTSARIRNSRKRSLKKGRTAGTAPNSAGCQGSVSLSDRLRYRFDNLLSRGPVALILILSILSALIVLIAAAVVSFLSLAPNGTGGFFPLLYKSLLHAIDTGTVAGDTGSPWFLLVMTMVTIGGIFIVSGLIGVITTGMDRKMDELRRGHSVVLESGHTLVLGWGPQVFTVISELVAANENQRRPCVVVLGNEDKVTMEEQIKARIGSTKNTRVVCRTGSPIEPADIQVGSPHTARSIILLSPVGEADADTQVIKTLLAIVNGPDRGDEKYHIVAELQNAANYEVAKLVAQDEGVMILGTDMTAKITVQTCRQTGLSAVYNELLDFEGDEIYFAHQPGLVGRTFAQALRAYNTSTLIGVHSASSGKTTLKPPMDYVLQHDDEIIAISEDDDTIVPDGTNHEILEDAIADPTTDTTPVEEHTLILGWNSSGFRILRELDHYVPAGSTTTIVAEEPVLHIDADRVNGSTFSRHTVSIVKGETTSRDVLDSLNISSFDHVLVLSEFDHFDDQQADARTLIILLHLRDIQEKSDQAFSIVSEMRDIRNRNLAEVTRADDFIVSDQLISLLMAQISENRHLVDVFDDLFDADGSEIYLKPAELYVQPGAQTDFFTVVEAARRRNEIAIGFRKSSVESAGRQHVVVNPVKSDPVQFQPGDKIVVLAED